MQVQEVVYDDGEPIDEQKARALAINEAIRRRISDFLDEQLKKLKIIFGVGIIVILLGGITLTRSVIGGIVILAGLGIIGGGYYYVQQQKPELQIAGLQKHYWTGYAIDGDDGALLFDATGTVSETEFELEQVQNHEMIKKSSEQIGEIGDHPVVMTDEVDVETEFTELLESIEGELEEASSRTVTAPVLPEDSEGIAAIKSLISHMDDETVSAKTEFELSQAKQDLESLSELANLAKENPVKDDLEKVTEVGETKAEELTAQQDAAINKLLDHINNISDAFAAVSYNFYCPNCEADSIESKLVFPDDAEKELYCETCRSYHTKDAVIPRHKIKDDVVLPTQDQLWSEKADQKRQIYENIEDKKLDLKEREFEQSREEIRTTTERIRDLRSKIRDLKTQAKAAEGAVDEIGDLMVKYDRLNQERKNEFSSEIDEVITEIEEETDQIIEEMRSEEQERLKKAEEEAEKKAEILRIEERQRQAEMIAAQEEIVKGAAQAQMRHQEAMTDAQISAGQNMTRAQISAEQDMTEAKLEQKAEHHKKDWLLETRGNTSLFDTIDSMKYWKDQKIGGSVRGD